MCQSHPSAFQILVEFCMNALKKPLFRNRGNCKWTQAARTLERRAAQLLALESVHHNHRSLALLQPQIYSQCSSEWTGELSSLKISHSVQKLQNCSKNKPGTKSCFSPNNMNKSPLLGTSSDTFLPITAVGFSVSRETQVLN